MIITDCKFEMLDMKFETGGRNIILAAFIYHTNIIIYISNLTSHILFVTPYTYLYNLS